MILPNYIGIGAPKAGTTWLATCVGEHPEAFMAAVKETEFWKLTDAGQRLEEYAKHFKGAEGRRAVGEFSVRYLSLPGVPERLKHVLPEARLIVCLRNPIDQVYSNYWHLQRQNFNLPDSAQAPRSIEEAVEKHRDFLLSPARYATHLTRWMQLFRREQLLVILYDDIQRRPAEVLRRAFAFLEIAPDFEPPSLHEKGSAVRQGTSPRSEQAARWHTRVYGGLVGCAYTPMKRMLGTRNAARIKEALRVRTVMERVFMRKGYPPMSQGTRTLLAKEFVSELEELSTLIGINLDSWRTKQST
jgi:hypothetical protein